MLVKQLHDLLEEFPQDMEVRFLVKDSLQTHQIKEVEEFKISDDGMIHIDSQIPILVIN